MSSWLNKFLNALDIEFVDVELVGHLDDILTWIGEGASNQSYVTLEKKYGSLVLFKRLENFLDGLVVSDSASGEMFPLILSGEHAKKRYRKLIRIFHPDRGANSQIWLNSRAEKVNKAYQHFLESKDLQEDLEAKEFSKKPVSDNVKKAEIKPRKFHVKAKLRYRPSVWRGRLGSPQEFQKKLLLILLCFSLLLILLVFLSNKELKKIEPLTYKNESLLAIQNPSLEYDYIVDSKAKKILQEADAFITSDVAGVGGDDFENDISVNLPLDKSIEHLSEFINELEQVSLLDRGEISENIDNDCYPYSRLTSNSLISNEYQSKKILSMLVLRSGPSSGCDVVASLPPGVDVHILAHTKDLMWSNIITKNGDAVVGWVDVRELNQSVEKKTIPNSLENKELKIESVINIKESRWQRALNVDGGKELVVKDVLQAPGFASSSSSVGVVNKSEPAYLDLIQNLKKYYEQGDSINMSELYIGSGRENQIKGADRIRKYYRKAFAKTANRSFNYTVTSYGEEKQSAAWVKGQMSLSMKVKKTGEVNMIDATFTIWLIKLSNDFKIASFEWSKSG